MNSNILMKPTYDDVTTQYYLEKRGGISMNTENDLV